MVKSTITMHKEGRHQIPVQVTINHQEATITAVPLSAHPQLHSDVETFYDFRLGLAIYWAPNETVCYLELLEDFSFDQAVATLKHSEGHFIRKIPETLFVVKAALSLNQSEWAGVNRLEELCSHREIHQLIANKEAEEDVAARQRRAVDHRRHRSSGDGAPSSAWAKATLDSAETRVDGFGYAQAYSQVGDQYQDQQGQRTFPRRLEATSGNPAALPSMGHQTRASFRSSPEKAGAPSFPSPFMAMPTSTKGFPSGFPTFPSGSQSSSSFSSSSSFRSSSLGSDNQDSSVVFPTNLLESSAPSPASWTGPIPADATVTQTPGSPHKTYTWKVTDASGYTTTHWYSGPLGPDRTPTKIRIPEPFGGEAVAPRRKIPSWTGPIPADATVTQTAGSSYKTYTWKVTDANGYTTTHWYSGPLGPDGGPAQFRNPLEPLELDQRTTQQQHHQQQQQHHQQQQQHHQQQQQHHQQQQQHQQRVQPTNNRKGATTVIQQQQSVSYQQGLVEQQPEPVRVTQPQQQTIQQHIAALEEYERQQTQRSQQHPVVKQPVRPQPQPDAPSSSTTYQQQQQTYQQQQQTTRRVKGKPAPQPLPTTHQTVISQVHQVQHFEDSGSPQLQPQPQPQAHAQPQTMVQRTHRQRQQSVEIARQQQLEQQRLEQQRLEQQRLEQQQLEQQRMEQEHQRLEQERLEQERLEQERLEQERLEQERLEQERLEQEQLEQQRLEHQRLEQQRIEQKRLEQQRLEQQRLEQQRLEQQRVEQMRMEQHRLEQQRHEQRRVEQQRIEQQQTEQRRVYQLEQQRLEMQQMEKERLYRQQLEQEQTDQHQQTLYQQRLEKQQKTQHAHRLDQRQKHRFEQQQQQHHEGQQQHTSSFSHHQSVEEEHVSSDMHHDVMEESTMLHIMEPAAGPKPVVQEFRQTTEEERLIRQQQEQPQRPTRVHQEQTSPSNNRGSFTPSRRADIPIEHDNQEITPLLPDDDFNPEPEPGQPEPHPVPGPFPGPVPDNHHPEEQQPAGEGSLEDYDYTGGRMCGETEVEEEESGCTSITGTSSTFEHHISMTADGAGSTIDHQQQQQFHQEHPIPGHPQQQLSGQRVSSYSRTIYSQQSSAILPLSSLPAMIPATSSSSSSSSGSGCQSSGFTYSCKIVYGPVRRTKICETVPDPAAATGPCCSVCS
jgi:hypothetical protein